MTTRYRASAVSCFVLLLLAAPTTGCSKTGTWRPKDFFSDPQVIALAVAAEHNDVAAIDRLIASGVNVNARGKDGMTPLLWAMWAKSKGGFQHLLEKGADPNIQLQNKDAEEASVTSTAAECGNDSDWLTLVLKHGANPNLLRHRGITTFTKQEDGSWKKEFTLLGPTPIFDAIDSCRRDHVDWLIKAGAKINFQDGYGDTPLLYAADHCRFDYVYTLLLAGADFRLKNRHGIDLARVMRDEPPAMFEEQRPWRAKVISFLEKKGMHVNAADGDGAAKQ
jgi:uncharacterized protein